MKRVAQQVFMIELVLDTNVLVAGLRSRRGASYQLLRWLAGNELRLNISVSLAPEYEDVLKRPGLVTGFTQAESNAFLDYVMTPAEAINKIQNKNYERQHRSSARLVR